MGTRKSDEYGKVVVRVQVQKHIWDRNKKSEHQVQIKATCLNKGNPKITPSPTLKRRKREKEKMLVK